MSVSSRAPFMAFILVSLQASFLWPYVCLVPKERTNLFTTTLTLVVLTVVLYFYRKRPKSVTGRSWNTWEVWAWSAFGLLVCISVLHSPARAAAGYRAYSFFAPALAGYWCGRLMSDDPLLNKYIEWILLGLYLGVSLVQIPLGFAPSFLGINHNGMANLLLLLAAGPLSLFVKARTAKSKIVYGCILATGFLACFLIGSRFVILLPFLFLPFLLLFGGMRKRTFFVLAGTFLTISAVFFTLLPGKILREKNYESVYYRVEGVPAALHIVKQHPFFGIGIWAPREPYLKDYKITSNLVDRKRFMRSVKRIETSDNVLTTMMVGFGLVPTLVYLGMMGGYCRRLFRVVKIKRESGILHPVIALSLAASLIHFTLHDGLLYPQINWFFHLFIGLLPLGTANQE